ncbi:flagellar export chaperone FlgN [Thiovibrio sp. JS02]
MAKTLPAKFYEILKEEIFLSEEMLRILSQEKEALVKMEMQTLLSLSGKKAALVSRLQALDAGLQESARAFTGASGDTVIRLRSLGSRLDAEEARSLEQYRLRLVELREEILARNIVNKRFSEETRRFLNDAISTITSTVAERPMYGRGKGFAKPSLHQPSFISREV